jgi:hypothetical protein
MSAAGAVGVLGGRTSLADEEPPEITTIRLSFTTSICFAPLDVAEELLRAEGFTDVRYVRAAGGYGDAGSEYIAGLSALRASGGRPLPAPPLSEITAQQARVAAVSPH